MTFTAQHLSTLTAMAGTDYSWPTGGSRPESDVRTGIMVFLADYAGGTCAFCGDAAPESEVCHIVSGGRGRKGWVPGNLAHGCLECNDIDGENGEIIALETILRPDLIPTEWPSTKDLRAMGIAAKNAKREAREIKRVKRGM